MHQQVNLFQPIFRKERKLFSFAVCLQIMMLFFVGLVLVFTFGLLNNNELKTQLETLKQQNTTRLAQLDKVTQELKSSGNINDSDSRITRLKMELEAERYLLTVLGKAYNQHRSGFSGYLEGFARRSISGMWIASFDMKNGGRSVRIKGGTVDPELIPRFIAGLSNEATLMGTEFELFTMLRETENRQFIEFSLSSGDFNDSPFAAAND